uniref:Uncharacterized protein n=1 Tax=Strigamia maritima TaxID=126957 RepID=T1J7H9_STRMM
MNPTYSLHAHPTSRPLGCCVFTKPKSVYLMSQNECINKLATEAPSQVIRTLNLQLHLEDSPG